MRQANFIASFCSGTDPATSSGAGCVCLVNNCDNTTIRNSGALRNTADAGANTSTNACENARNCNSSAHTITNLGVGIGRSTCCSLGSHTKWRLSSVYAHNAHASANNPWPRGSSSE